MEQAAQLKESKMEQAAQLKEQAVQLDKQEKALSKLQLDIEKIKAASETLGKVGALVVAVLGIVIPLFGDAIKDALNKGIGLLL
jgi:sortase (surface protein transpeptidase)